MSRAARSGALLGLLAVLGLGGLLAADVAWARTHPGGAAFWPLWRGARAFLLTGASPYAPVTAGPQPPWAAGHTFDLPLYAVVWVAPYALIADYVWARALWMWTLQLALLVSGLLATRLWRGPGAPRRWLVVALLAAGPWSVAAVLQGRFVVLLLPLAVLAAAGWRVGRVWGPALAAVWLIARPAFFGPWLLAWGLWLLSRRHGQRALGAWLGLSAVAWLVGRGLQANWFSAYLTAWWRGHQPAAGVLWGAPQALRLALPGVGPKLGWALVVGTLLWLLIEGVAAWGKSWLHAAWFAALALALTPWIGLPLAPEVAGLSVVLVGPLIWALWDQRWLYGPTAVVFSSVGGSLVAWALSRASDAGGPIVGPGLGYGWLPLGLVFGLYWVRWWATHADWWAE